MVHQRRSTRISAYLGICCQVIPYERFSLRVTFEGLDDLPAMLFAINSSALFRMRRAARVYVNAFMCAPLAIARSDDIICWTRASLCMRRYGEALTGAHVAGGRETTPPHTTTRSWLCASACLSCAAAR